MKYLNLLCRGLEANWKTLLEYKEEFYTELLSNFFDMAVALVVWGLIFTKVSDINGWTMGSVILISAFITLFHGFTDFLFSGVWSIEKLIIYGEIDKYLPRPVEPLFIELAYRIDFYSIRDFVRFIIMTGVAAFLGAHIGLELILGIFLCFVAATIFSLIGLCIQFLSFWFGKSNALKGLFSLIWNFADYPMTIFPQYFQKIFIFLIPLFVAGSIPAMAVIKMITTNQMLEYIAIMLAIAALWICIMLVLWKKGIKKYDSYGG